MQKLFTDPFLRSLQPDPTGQVDYVADRDPHPAVSGRLGIRVGKKTKSWFIRYSVDGTRRRLLMAMQKSCLFERKLQQYG
jgi:hypothetical protein